MGSSSDRVKPNTIKFVFVASRLSTQHQEVKAKTGWLGIRIMCQEWSNIQYLPADCFYSELALSNPIKLVDLVQSGHSLTNTGLI